MVTNTAELPSSTTFNWRIENFSKLNAKDGAYSDVFSVGSFKWKAQIYPKGSTRVYDHDRLSLFIYPVFLTKSVDMECSFTVSSQTYPTIRMRRETKHKCPPEWLGWGWTKFMCLSELHDPDKGYIVNDTCVITVEVTCTAINESEDDDGLNEGNTKKVVKTEEEKHIIKEKDELPSSTTFNWRIENFSKLNAKDGAYSDVFSVGSVKWKAKIYPKGDKKVYDHDHLSLFIHPVFLTKSVDMECSFTVSSQTYPSIRMRRETKDNCTPDWRRRGWHRFMCLSELHDPDKGYIVNDTCVITIEVTCTMINESEDDDGLNEGNSKKVVKTTEEEKHIIQEKDDKSSPMSTGKYPERQRIYCLMACFKK